MFERIRDEDREKIWILGIFVLALVLRIIYLLQIKANPHFFSPTMDPLYHDAWAQNIAGGNWIGSKVFFRAPFYAYFLALVYKIFGHSYIIPRVIQHLLGSFSCVLVYFLARRLFNRKVAIVSGIIAATYGMLMYFEGELLLDSFLVLFDLLLLLFLLRAKENPRFYSWLICGIVLGFSAITRPNILVFVPFVWLWIILVFRKKKTLKAVLTYSAAFLLGGILVISPVTLRNVIAGKDTVLIASQGGINFYIGNNTNADGVSAIFYKEDWQYRDFQQMAERETGQSLKPSEISSFYYRKGMDFYLENPSRAFKLLVKKLYLFWSRFEISNNQNIYFFRQYSSLIRILPLGFWLVGPLGLTGMILSLRALNRSKKTRSEKVSDRRKRILLPILFILSYMATVVMFFVPARFRLPIIPLLLVFSGFSLVWLFERLQEKKVSFVGTFLLILIPFALLTNSNAYHLRVGDFSQAHFSLGNVYLKDGKLDLALAEFNSVLTLNPGYNRAHLNRGMVFFRRGDLEQAEKEFQAELELNPNEAKAYNNLSAVYQQQGLHQKAEEMAEKAIRLGGYSANAYMNLAMSYWKEGKIHQAKQTIAQGLAEVRPFLEGELLLGEIYLTEGQNDSAVERFENVIHPPASQRDVAYDLEILAAKGDPHRLDKQGLQAKAHFNLGTVYVGRGEISSAETHLKRAISLKPDFAEAHANLGILFDHTGRGDQALLSLKRAINLDPRNAVYHFNLGLAYAKLMKLREAREEFETTLALDPSLTDAHQKLRLVDSLLQVQGVSP
ncbi:MAG: tetratricopeptide repeat protein [Candidatus Zixiibacteriota bacterium]|nr:MAG: tetratricopeptide repeat protein [candidate division Zixibacteria bacterium]